MNFEMINDNVLVKRELQKEIVPGTKIESPESTWSWKMHGTVVAVGPGLLRMQQHPNERHTMQVRVGNIVICPQGMVAVHADPLNPNPQEQLWITTERQILAILRP